MQRTVEVVTDGEQLEEIKEVEEVYHKNESKILLDLKKFFCVV